MKRKRSVLVWFVLCALLLATAACREDQLGENVPTATQIASGPDVSILTATLAQTGTTAPQAPTTQLTPTETPCVPPAGWEVYTVKAGETLFEIALRYDMTAEELQQVNCLSSPDEIVEGQSLYVPFANTPTPTPCTPPEGWVRYAVQAGETLFAIALRYGMSPEELQQANCLPSSDEIVEGQWLYVPFLVTLTPTPCAPPASWVRYTVQPGETLFAIALRYGMTARELQEANCLSSPDQIQSGQTLFVPYYIAPTSMPAPTSIPVPPAATRVPPAPTRGIPPDLLEQIFYNDGGELEPAVCADPVIGEPYQITISARDQEDFELCVYGFPMGAEIKVELSAPDGHKVGEESFEVTETVDGFGVARIPLWMPVGLPVGDWSARAEHDGTVAEGSFPIPQYTERAISTMPTGDIDPFVKKNCTTYLQTEQVVIRGINYPAVQEISLGIYVTTGGVYEGLPVLALFDGEPVTTDIDGAFSTTIQLDEYTPGKKYRVILATHPITDTYHKVEPDHDCFVVGEGG